LALPKKPQINWLIKEQTLEHKRNTSLIEKADAFANESIEKLKLPNSWKVNDYTHQTKEVVMNIPMKLLKPY
jgi:hypothetical protein